MVVSLVYERDFKRSMGSEEGEGKMKSRRGRKKKGVLRKSRFQTENEIFLSIVYMGGNRKMAVENTRSCRERPILSLLVPELPKGEWPVIVQ